MTLFRRWSRRSRLERDVYAMQYVENQKPDALVEALNRELTEDAGRRR
ncbi:MAG TPA: hypothetical protein VMU99_09585 [Acidimicrobiales bacterium]|nr:hypothetical protein [Acidimicrobiales bacterium]